MIWDADTICDPAALQATIADAEYDHTNWGQPYRRKVKLNETASSVDRRQAPTAVVDVRVYGRYESATMFKAAPPLVASRCW